MTKEKSSFKVPHSFMIIGERDKGVTRLTYSPSWKAALSYLSDTMSSLDVEVSVDPIGNLIGKAKGSKANQKPVAIGSHLDTVVNGGAFDGAMGIIVGLEFMSTLRENDIKLNSPLDLIAFAEEEGSL